MKITLIPSGHAPAGEAPYQYLTSYLVNDRIVIDAGCIGFWQGPTEQAAIGHIFLSHSHIDHLASLPLFLENIADLRQGVCIYASEFVQQSLRLDLFNGRVWPKFLEMKINSKPFVTMVTLQSGQAVEVEGLRVTPMAVNHTVPTLGFLLEDKSHAVVIAADTGPTAEIWTRANQTGNLRAVFLEASFPNELGDLADSTRHLTPAGFVTEMKKTTQSVRFVAVHLKAQYRERLTQQLLAHRLPNLEIARFGTAYEF